MRIGRTIERWVILTHRWVGIAVCLLFVLWFVSGLVMLYVTYPRLTEAERRAGLPSIDWQQVQVGPRTALIAAAPQTYPKSLRLEMSAGDPVYRISDWGGRETTISAIDGRLIETIDAERAVQIAREFAPASDPTWKGETYLDQWTFAATLDPVRPLHRVALSDDADREIYVSARTGAVVMDTTRQERFWNWLGLIPHLMSLDEIRARPSLWRNLLMWTTVPSTIVALLGLWLGITRLRLIKRYPRGSISPFRGLMKWHQVVGVLGGVFLFVWIAGGLIYLRPNGLLVRKPIPSTALQHYAGASAGDFPLDLRRLTAAAPHDVRMASFAWLGGRPFVFLTDQHGATAAFDAEKEEFGAVPESLIAEAARRLVPAERIARISTLTEPDEYWHTFKLTFRQLPVLRVEFDDAGKQWFHIDPVTGEVLNTSDTGDRAFRWLFNGLHRFDFLFLLQREWLRDAVVWLLMLAGLALSATGVIVGWRRLRHSR